MKFKLGQKVKFYRTPQSEGTECKIIRIIEEKVYPYSIEDCKGFTHCATEVQLRSVE